MTNVLIDARRGAGSSLEILYGTVTWKPTLTHARGTSIVLPAPTTFDLVDGKATATNVQPTPEPVEGKIQWGYEVTFKDRHSKTYSFLVGVPDSTTPINFASLPRYFETAPPLFGQGEQGIPGEAATIAIGDVVSGSVPEVNNSGTANDAVLDFVLPKGDKGDTGAGVPAGGSALQVIRKNSGNTSTEWATLTKALVGLGNVDNTSDANKPLSNPQKTYVDQINTLPLGSKTASESPSTYSEGVTVFIGNTTDGWPEVEGGFETSVQVKTERTPLYPSSIQYVTARVSSTAGDPNNNEVLYRIGNFNNTWGDWQRLVNSKDNKTFVRKGEMVVNVKDFGAVADGVTDDTPYIQAAIDSLSATGGTVYLPPSDTGNPYRVGRLWVGFDDLTFEADSSVVLKRKGLSWGLANRVPGTLAIKDLNDPYSGPSNITVIGGTWDGAIADEPYVPEGFNCHFFNAARNIVFKDMVIRNIVSNHALDLNALDGVLIDNVRFEGYKDATSDQSRDYTEAIQLSTMNASPGSMDMLPDYSNGAATRNVLIRNCYFGVSGTPGTQAWPCATGNHAAINRSRNNLLTGAIVIENNLFDGLTFTAITPYTWDNVTISNNNFKACYRGIQANNFTQGRRWNPTTKAYESAPLRENCFDMKIVNNTFVDTGQTSIAVFGTGVSSTDGSWGKYSRVIIKGNACYRSAGGRSSLQFIRVILSSDVIISGNVGGHSSVGIAVQGCLNTTVTGNSIVNTLGYGILVDATGNTPALPVENTVVEGNSVVDAGSHGIGVNGVTGFVCSSNLVKNNAREIGGAALLFSGSKSGVVAANNVLATSTPNNINGIQGSGSTDMLITLTNRIQGVTTFVTSIGGSGVVYDNLKYT